MYRKPIRVLHILGKRPVGGVGTFLKNMNANVDLNRVKFDYLLCAKEPIGEFDTYVMRYGAKVYVLPELKYSNIVVYLKELYYFMRKYATNYDIIHVHVPNIAAFNLYLAKKFDIKIRIIHSHSIKYSDSLLKSMRNFLLQVPIRHFANAYMACSVDSAKFLFRKEFFNNKVKIINNAISIQDFLYNEDVRKIKRKELGIDNNMVVGQIGSFLPVKNHNFSIKIMQEILKIKKNSVMIFVGDGVLEKEIKEKVKNIGLSDNIKFLGRRDDIRDLLQAMDVMIIPSLFEGIPLVGIEAQVSGLPIVLSDTITEDLKINDSVHYASIKKSPKEWAEIIISAYEQEHSRDNMHEFFKNSGYDIVREAKKLTYTYESYLSSFNI
ncbi:MAG: glycosyltransferase family 1 protein [Clostridiales bacterium]|nr:glycosyltransferase family 1 protein [Clostridiales bacterium]